MTTTVTISHTSRYVTVAFFIHDMALFYFGAETIIRPVAIIVYLHSGVGCPVSHSGRTGHKSRPR